MLSTAFGKLPEPTLSTQYCNPLGLEFADIPDWAAPSLENLISSCLLTGETVSAAQTYLYPDDLISVEELETMISRVYTYLAKREQDDFWAASNRDWRNINTLYPGYGVQSPFVQVSLRTISEVAMDVISIADSGENTRIANFYNSYMDTASRDKAGAAQLQPYLTAFRSATTLEELLEALYQCYRETGISLLYDFTPTVNDKDSDYYILAFTFAGISMNKDHLTEPLNHTVIDGLVDYLETLLQFAGYSKSDAQNAAQLILQYNLEMAPLEWDPQELHDVSKTYNLYSKEELQVLFSNIDLDIMRQVQGYSESDTMQVLVENPAALAFFASKCSDEHLELLKAIVTTNLVGGCSAFLTTDLNQKAHDFEDLYTGVESNLSMEEYAYYYTRNVLEYDINRHYAQSCSDKEKQEVTEIIEDMIEIFRGRIDQLEWMSEETKVNAKKKLDTMKIRVGYPDDWKDPLEGAELLPPKKGENSALENMLIIYRAQAKKMSEILHETVDKDSWGSDLMTVNAYYSPITNSITVPAGTLQSPFYASDASLEENLAGVGFFIAHEITHSFDNNGAKYDENGNAADWWTEEDYQAFEQLCAEAVEYFDGIEAAPGIVNDGTRTLSENIADLGAMSCVLDVLAQQPNPDYEAFFRAYSACWASNTQRSYLEYLATFDVHSFDNIRVNRVVSAFEQFYETFGVKEDDGMYVAPQERPLIW